MAEKEKSDLISDKDWIDVYFKLIFDQLDDEEKTNYALDQIITSGQIMHMIGLVGIAQDTMKPLAKIGDIYLDANGRPHENLYDLKRNFAVQYYKSKRVKSSYEVLVRATSRIPILTKNDPWGLKYLVKEKNKTFGYSPRALAKDLWLLAKLDRQIQKQVQGSKSNPQILVYFNKKNDPCIEAKIGATLHLAYRVQDRLELRLKKPELEKACFSDKFEDCVKFLANESDNNLIRISWLKVVKKLLWQYKPKSIINKVLTYHNSE